MPHIVTEKCIKCKYTDCVEVCPVDCFHEGDEYLVIDPDVCIDCGVCIPECPIEAIVNDDNYIDGKSVEIILAADENSDLTKNQKNLRTMADFNKAKSATLPCITQKKQPMEDADHWSCVYDKIHFIEHADSKN